MERRGFIAGLLAAFGFAKSTIAESNNDDAAWQVEWNSPHTMGRLDHETWTDNPKWFGKIGFGPDNNPIFINGENVSRKYRVTRLQTGPDGWVEYLALDSSNRPIIVYGGPRNYYLRMIRYGNVAYRPALSK